jgi:DNA modification methylase
VAPTQEALYADIDLELSWSEGELPERERTKHVHRLHPYLGKFIPQLVEVLLERYFRRGQHVLDPFAGSGTTAVQALESGLDATAVELAAFNTLLISVKTARYQPFRLERELRDARARLDRFDGEEAAVDSEYLRGWYAPAALTELLFWRDLVPDYEHGDVLRVVLSRAARSARRAPHFDLEAPRKPQLDNYWCHKHRRVCRPVADARRFLHRYAEDTVLRVREFGRVRSRSRRATVFHADARTVRYDACFDGIVTSPPYPGLIDYHEQHRYAYELLGLEDRSDAELGTAADGTTRAALASYSDGIVATLANAAPSLKRGAPVVIVVNDRRDLYPEILERAGLRLEARLRRHVNRRTSRRAGEFFEDVLVARA